MVTAIHSANAFSEHRPNTVSAMRDSSAATRLEIEFLTDQPGCDRATVRLSARSLLGEAVQLRLLASEEYLVSGTASNRHIAEVQLDLALRDCVRIVHAYEGDKQTPANLTVVEEWLEQATYIERLLADLQAVFSPRHQP